VRKLPLYIFVVFVAVSFIPQQVSRPLVIKAKVDEFNVDNLGNVYVVKEDELMKFLPSGKFFARYSNLRLGRITHIDVTNPLKILLYYRDYQQIVFLDNQLSVNSEVVSLESLGYEQTYLVCVSANNSFWIYNKQNNELLRFNEHSKKVSSTGNLKQMLHADLNPEFMVEHNGFLYMNSPGGGIYVFDMFGAFSKVISLKGFRSFQVTENLIYFQRDSLFCSYDHRIFEERCKLAPYYGLSTGARFSNGKLYSAFKDSLLVEKL